MSITIDRLTGAADAQRVAIVTGGFRYVVLRLEAGGYALVVGFTR